MWFKPITRKKCIFSIEKKEGTIFILFFEFFFYGWSALQERSFEVSKDLKVAKLVATDGGVGLYTA